jgi:hypothetical protein
MICVLFLFDDADDDNVNTNEVLFLFLRRGSFSLSSLLWVHKLWEILKGSIYYTWEVLAIAISQKGIDRYFMAALVRVEYIYTHTHIGFDKF